MREIRLSGSMSGEWKRLRPRHSSTLLTGVSSSPPRFGEGPGEGFGASSIGAGVEGGGSRYGFGGFLGSMPRFSAIRRNCSNWSLLSLSQSQLNHGGGSYGDELGFAIGRGYLL